MVDYNNLIGGLLYTDAYSQASESQQQSALRDLQTQLIGERPDDADQINSALENQNVERL